jgi:hypothetical protein
MHDFYPRMDRIFKRFGSNRHRFCEKHPRFKYQTLQSYWNTDKLPPGDVLEALAREYNVSLDTLVLGRRPEPTTTDNPVLNRVTVLLRQMDADDLLRAEGAIQVLQALGNQVPAGPTDSAPGPAGEDSDPDEWAELEEVTDE